MHVSRRIGKRIIRLAPVRRHAAFVCHACRIVALGFALMVPDSLRAAGEPEEAQYNVVVSLYNAGQLGPALKKVDEREAAPISDAMRARYLQVRGLIHERAGRQDEARNAYAALIERHPGAPECNPARVALLYLDHAAGRSDAVLKGYSAIRQEGLSAEAHRDMALMRAEALAATGGEPRETIAAYRQSLKAGADASLVNPRLFDLYLQIGDHAELLNVSSGGMAGMDPGRLAMVRSEAFLALKRYAEAETAAAAVPADHALGPRAAYVRAQALIGLKRPADAVAPLADALARWREVPAPAVAWLTLASCQSQAGQAKAAAVSIAKARRHLPGLAADTAADVRQRLALLEVHLALQAGDGDVAAVIERLRDDLPKDRLPELLYHRVHALSALPEGRAALLETMERDFAVIQKGAYDAPSSRVYAQALEAAGRSGDARRVLEDLVQRRPDAPDSTRARLDLAARDLAENRLKEAEALFDRAAKDDLRALLAPAALHDVQFNRAVLAMRLDRPEAAIARLRPLLADEAVAKDLRTASERLLAQAYEQAGQYAQAASAWAQVAGEGKSADVNVLERAAAAYVRAEKADQALAVFARIEESAALNMSPESLHLYARILLDRQRPADAAARYARLYAKAGSSPAHAFECAVAWQRAGDAAQAAEWFETAGRRRERLPERYAVQLDALLAQARLQSGTGDRGIRHWLAQIVPGAEPDALRSSLAALRQILSSGRIPGDLPDHLSKAAQPFRPGHPDRISLMALRVAVLAALEQRPAQQEAAEAALRELTAAEASLPPDHDAATLAPAMIRYYLGDALRRAGRPAEALVEFETVLAVYPYNEWPDAAACGAADCFADLGEPAQAVARFEDVINHGGESPESARWREYARQRRRQLTEGKEKT